MLTGYTGLTNRSDLLQFELREFLLRLNTYLNSQCNVLVTDLLNSEEANLLYTLVFKAPYYLTFLIRGSAIRINCSRAHKHCQEESDYLTTVGEIS